MEAYAQRPSSAAGGRRYWTTPTLVRGEKLRIVAQSHGGPRLVSLTARRYGISPSLLFAWRRSFRPVPIAKSAGDPVFVPTVGVPEACPGVRQHNLNPPTRRITLQGRSLRDESDAHAAAALKKSLRTHRVTQPARDVGWNRPGAAPIRAVRPCLSEPLLARDVSGVFSPFP